MSKYKDKDGYHVFECDLCGETTGGEHKEFSEAWEEAKREGFFYSSSIGHFCNECKGDF